MKRPIRVLIDNTLKSLQEIVGGYIENYALTYHAGIICNEEAVFRDLKFNMSYYGQFFFGTIIFIGYDGEEFCSCPWDESEMKELFPQLWRGNNG